MVKDREEQSISISLKPIADLLARYGNDIPRWVNKDFKELDLHQIVGMDANRDSYLCEGEYATARRYKEPNVTVAQIAKGFEKLTETLERFATASALHDKVFFSRSWSAKEACNIISHSIKEMPSRQLLNNDFVTGALFCEGTDLRNAFDGLIDPKNGHPEERAQAVKEVLEKIPEKYRGPYVLKLLGDPDENVRLAAFTYFNKTPKEYHYAILAKAVRDGSENVRMAAVYKFDCNERFPSLLFGLLQDGAERVQKEALQKLYTFLSRGEYEEMLRSKINSGASTIAMEGLTYLPRDKMVVILREIWNDPFKYDDKTAIAAVEKIGKNSAGMLKEEFLPLYSEAFMHPSEQVRIAVLHDLASYFSGESLASFLEAGLNDPSSKVQVFAAGLVHETYFRAPRYYDGLLEMVMSSPNENVRIAAVKSESGLPALASLVRENKSIYPYLERLLEGDPSPKVRDAAEMFITSNSYRLQPEDKKQILAQPHYISDNTRAMLKN